MKSLPVREAIASSVGETKALLVEDGEAPTDSNALAGNAALLSLTLAVDAPIPRTIEALAAPDGVAKALKSVGKLADIPPVTLPLRLAEGLALPLTLRVGFPDTVCTPTDEDGVSDGVQDALELWLRDGEGVHEALPLLPCDAVAGVEPLLVDGAEAVGSARPDTEPLALVATDSLAVPVGLLEGDSETLGVAVGLTKDADVALALAEALCDPIAVPEYEIVCEALIDALVVTLALCDPLPVGVELADGDGDRLAIILLLAVTLCDALGVNE